MPFSEDVTASAAEILTQPWVPRSGLRVPDVDNVVLSGGVVEISGSVLFSDLASSTALVRDHLPQFVSHVVKAFLDVAVRCIRRQSGEVRSFDGDRVMAVYLGSQHAERSVRSALLLNGTMQNVVIPMLRRRWTFNHGYDLGFATGVDTGQLHVIRAGIRNNNDLIFLGLATNTAAKLSQLRRPPFSTFVTQDVLALLGGTNLLATDTHARVFAPLFQNIVSRIVYGTNCTLLE